MKGFALVEILVTLTIAAIISGFLIVNFSRSRTELNNSVLTVVDALRFAQAQALAGALYSGSYRCGWGVRFASATTYSQYVGPDSSGTVCSTQDRRYNLGPDTLSPPITLPNASLTFNVPGPLYSLPLDIFFEPPDPKTYLNGSTGGVADVIIEIRNNGSTNCPSIDCYRIYVSTSGLIRTQ